MSSEGQYTNTSNFKYFYMSNANLHCKGHLDISNQLNASYARETQYTLPCLRIVFKGRGIQCTLNRRTTRPRQDCTISPNSRWGALQYTQLYFTSMHWRAWHSYVQYTAGAPLMVIYVAGQSVNSSLEGTLGAGKMSLHWIAFTLHLT